MVDWDPGQIREPSCQKIRNGMTRVGKMFKCATVRLILDRRKTVPIAMALTAAHTWFWAHVLLLCATSVTSMRINFNIEAPKTFWVDKTCIQKGFSPTTAQESIDIALLSAHRLVNLNDDYQAFIYNLLFKAVRDFGLEDDSWTETWNVVGERLPRVFHPGGAVQTF